MAGFCTILLFLLGNLFSELVWGLNMFQDSGTLQDLQDPTSIRIRKVLTLCQHIGMFIIPAFLFGAIFSKEGFRGYFLMKRPPDGQTLFLVTLICIFSFPVINGLSELNHSVAFPEFLKGIEEKLRQMENRAIETYEAFLKMNDPLDLFGNLVLIAIIPAIGEELIFRGVLLRSIARWSRNVHLAIWLSGILFSLIHFQFFGLLPRMFLGILFGYLVLWTGSIWSAILPHFINNATAVTLSYFMGGTIGREAEDMGATGDLSYFLGGLLGTVLILFTLNKRRRKGMKKVLTSESAEDQ